MTALEDYIKAQLSHEMRRHRGNKRIRKKRAKAALHRRWQFLRMAAPISRRFNYAEIGRQMFSVEPLPNPVSLPYCLEEVQMQDIQGDAAPETNHQPVILTFKQGLTGLVVGTKDVVVSHIYSNPSTTDQCRCHGEGECAWCLENGHG
jgi:hypothetical protein